MCARNTPPGETPPGPAQPKAPSRLSSRPPFWDERYGREEHLFGTAPSAFVVEEAERLPEGAAVVELGAGEARNLVYLAKARGHRTTAVDFAGAGLRKAQAWAAAENVELRAVEADVRAWQPPGGQRWDAVLVTFLHLLPEERPALYGLLQRLVRPGGLVMAEWFRAEHLQKAEEKGYARIGPSKADRLVTAGELRRHFREGEVLRCDEVDVMLGEGPVLQGRAAVLRFVWQKDVQR